MEPMLSNIWELYGLKENPFSTTPLLVKGGTLPIESFVGRTEQLQRLLRIFGSKGGSRVLICGDTGVGKTTFVNYARNHAWQNGFFTPFKEIGIQPNWDADHFILNTLAGIHATTKILKDRPLSDDTVKKLETLLEIRNTDYDAGISIMGFGANYGQQTRGPSFLATTALETFFADVTAEIAKNTGKDIIIHYNNLELMPENNITKLFNSLRDLLQTPNVHYVFVGNLTVKSAFSNMPRVSSIMTDTPIMLGNLQKEEIEKILRIRMDKTRIGADFNYVLPYKPEVLETLYELYEGNIRDILNSLSTAVTEIVKEKPVVLDRTLIARTLKTVVERRYLTDLQPKAKEVLIEAIKHPEVTNSELSKNTKIARTNISLYLKQLETKGCINLRRKEGKEKYWTIDPKIKWLLLTEGDSGQKTITDY